MTNAEFEALLRDAPDNLAIIDALVKMRSVLSQHERIAVSYSSGSDSDVMLDMIELIKPENCGEVRYVFFDTGLEWDATHRHVAEIEQRYDITIDKRRAKKPIPVACKEYGVPFISKDMSKNIATLQKNNFDFSIASEAATSQKYSNCADTVDWYFDRRALSSTGRMRPTIAERKLLHEYMTENPPHFKISERCCNHAKKKPAQDYRTEFPHDLSVTGMRQSERGVRSTAYKSCFSPPSAKKKYAEYRPLWWMSDADKQVYKDWRGLRYSDCYEVWGFKRTGCVGCPCSSRATQDLETARTYEPKKVQAAYAVFGESYKYREAYNRYKKHGNQMTWEDLEL